MYSTPLVTIDLAEYNELKALKKSQDNPDRAKYILTKVVGIIVNNGSSLTRGYDIFEQVSEYLKSEEIIINSDQRNGTLNITGL